LSRGSYFAIGFKLNRDRAGRTYAAKIVSAARDIPGNPQL